jgi:hypothetical protein
VGGKNDVIFLFFAIIVRWHQSLLPCRTNLADDKILNSIAAIFPTNLSHQALATNGMKCDKALLSVANTGEAPQCADWSTACELVTKGRIGRISPLEPSDAQRPLDSIRNGQPILRKA